MAEDLNFGNISCRAAIGARKTVHWFEEEKAATDDISPLALWLIPMSHNSSLFQGDGVL